MYSRKVALSQARQYRSCPPPEKTDALLDKKILDQHLAICPYCSREDYQDIGEWQEIINTEIPVPGINLRQEKKIAPGQFRKIKSNLGGWKNNYYYNPPMVLVLDAGANIADEVLVAQTYHDTGLAAPGDLILSDEQTGIGPLFIECENIYTLRKSDLDLMLVGGVDEKILNSVEALGKNNSLYPEWALPPDSLIENDPRTYFQEMEMETGNYFSSKALAEITNKSEAKSTDILYNSIGELISEVKKRISGISWPDFNPESFQDVFALAKFPQQMLPKGCSDDDGETFISSIAEITAGKIKGLRPASGVILQRRKSEDEITISGEIDNQGGLQKHEFYCIALGKNNEIIKPLWSDWDNREGFFQVKFKLSDNRDIRLAISLVVTIDNE